MIQGFHHTSFTVGNADEAERFFVEFFDMERIGGGLYDFDYIRRAVGYPDAVLKISVLRLPGHTHLLELVEYIAPVSEPVDTATCRAGAAHLCFRVDDIESEYARLCERGVKFKSTPNEVTYGINKGAKAVYFNGPSGIALELFQPALSAKNDGETG